MLASVLRAGGGTATTANRNLFFSVSVREELLDADLMGKKGEGNTLRPQAWGSGQGREVDKEG